MVTAYRHGAPLQKLFPGVAGGAAWVKAVSSALPMLNINPTSGVTLENAGEYLNMGAASVGLVAPLFDPVAIANEDWDQIAKNAEIGKLQREMFGLKYEHTHTHTYLILVYFAPKLTHTSYSYSSTHL